jgi:hypothetical protein
LLPGRSADRPWQALIVHVPWSRTPRPDATVGRWSQPIGANGPIHGRFEEVADLSYLALAQCRSASGPTGPISTGARARPTTVSHRTLFYFKE